MRLPILTLLLLLCTCVSAQKTDAPENDGREIIIRTEGQISTTAPLFIVDGITYEQGSINELDPNNIESISVHKDASATALYGAAGANGVVVITTKNGNYTRPNYTLTPAEIPVDIFSRYAELKFGAGKEVVYLLNGKPRKLKALSKLNTVDIMSIRVYEGPDKAKRIGQEGKDIVVAVKLR